MQIVMVGGGGYVGLTTGVGYASLGHSVTLVESNDQKLTQLQAGKPPFFEPGLDEALKKYLTEKHITCVKIIRDAVTHHTTPIDIIMIAVGTPANPDGSADLSAVFAVAKTIGEVLTYPVVLVVKSTVPVGTNRAVLRLVKEQLVTRGLEDVANNTTIASVPEFLRPGFALTDFLSSERLVIGSESPKADACLRALHEKLNTPVVSMSLESAELGKYAANAFLATKVSFVNELATYAEHIGADIIDITKSMGYDKRIGPHFLQAGIGYGGACLSKDVLALQSMMQHAGQNPCLVSSVIEVNTQQLNRFFDRVNTHFGNNLTGHKLAIWGLAFKGGTDDIRGSLAIDLVTRFARAGAYVATFDPQATDNAKPSLPQSIVYTNTAIDATKDAEALLILADWKEFQTVDFQQVKKYMKSPIIFDGKNLLAHLPLKELGFTYVGVGR